MNNHIINYYSKRMSSDVVQTSTLPLNEGDILHHAKLVSEVYKLCPRLMTLVCQSWEMSLSYLN